MTPRSAAVKSLTIIPPNTLANLKGWDKLSKFEQRSVQNETQGLTSAMIQMGKARLSIGQHLTRLRDLLEPHNMFVRFLSNFHFSQRTAYRYMEDYKNVKARFSEPILQAALARNFNISGTSEEKPLGTYTEAYNQLPAPPKSPSLDAANEWLDKLDAYRKATPAVAEDVEPIAPDDCVKEAFKLVKRQINKLEDDSKVKTKALKKLFGMLLTEIGVIKEITISPIDIPEAYQTTRGRPKETAAAAGAEAGAKAA